MRPIARNTAENIVNALETRRTVFQMGACPEWQVQLVRSLRGTTVLLKVPKPT